MIQLLSAVYTRTFIRHFATEKTFVIAVLFVTFTVNILICMYCLLILRETMLCVVAITRSCLVEVRCVDVANPSSGLI